MTVLSGGKKKKSKSKEDQEMSCMANKAFSPGQLEPLVCVCDSILAINRRCPLRGEVKEGHNRTLFESD